STSRSSPRSRIFPRVFPAESTPPWFASVPADDSSAIKGYLTLEQWKQPHTFAVDWYQVRDGAGTVTDVMFDFYIDVMVNERGSLVRINDPTTAPVKLHSYSLKQVTEEHNRTENTYTLNGTKYPYTVPDWQTL